MHLISRGLFEKDKLVFSFMICTDIMRQAEAIDDMEWNFFLRGNAGAEKTYPNKPAVPWLSDQDRNAVCSMEVINFPVYNFFICFLSFWFLHGF